MADVSRFLVPGASSDAGHLRLLRLSPGALSLFLSGLLPPEFRRPLVRAVSGEGGFFECLIRLLANFAEWLSLELESFEELCGRVCRCDAMDARDVEKYALAAVSATSVYPSLFLPVFGAPVGAPRG